MSQEREFFSQKKLKNLEIDFSECDFTYEEVTIETCTVSDRIQNTLEKVSRKSSEFFSEQPIQPRYDDCSFGPGDSKVQIQNLISEIKPKVNLRFKKCKFIKKEHGLLERVWQGISELIPSPFNMQLTTICEVWQRILESRPFQYDMQLTTITSKCIVQIEGKTFSLERLGSEVISDVVKKVQEDI